LPAVAPAVASQSADSLVKWNLKTREQSAPLPLPPLLIGLNPAIYALSPSGQYLFLTVSAQSGLGVFPGGVVIQTSDLNFPQGCEKERRTFVLQNRWFNRNALVCSDGGGAEVTLWDTLSDGPTRMKGYRDGQIVKESAATTDRREAVVT
jgi:hypothetical protein